MSVKSEQEITDKQAVYRDVVGWEDLHTHRKHGKMVLMYRIAKHLIKIPASTIFQPVDASQKEDITRYLVLYCSVGANKFAFPHQE